MGPPVVDVRELRKSYGRCRVLDGVALAVEEGAICALVGENGAGKTTLLEILMGLRHPDSGSVRLLGVNALTDDPALRARIGFLSETVPFYQHMRAREAVAFHRAFFSDWDDAHALRLMERLKIEPEATVAQLSRGQKLRLGLVCTLAHHPPLMIFDEITAGMDPIVRADLVQLIREEQAARGATVLFATNLLHQLRGFATHIAFLRDGRLSDPAPVDPSIADLEQYFIDRHRGAA